MPDAENLAFAVSGSGMSAIATLPPQAFGLVTVTQLARRDEISIPSFDAQLRESQGWIARLRQRIASNGPLTSWLQGRGYTTPDVVGFYRKTDGKLWLIVDDRV
ncbi:hypothetical protein CVM50_08560 [Pseudooceanicola marinus]|nr:hypothetical protein CVM50_08560 [Pseudooceanicola marinus]